MRLNSWDVARPGEEEVNTLRHVIPAVFLLLSRRLHRLQHKSGKSTSVAGVARQTEEFHQPNPVMVAINGVCKTATVAQQESVSDTNCRARGRGDRRRREKRWIGDTQAQ